jgi:hypothetical protein
MFFRNLGLTCVAMLIAGTLEAAVIVTTETDKAPAGTAGDPYSPTFVAGGPSSSDLLEGLSPSDSTDVGAAFTIEMSTGLPALTNGSVDTFYGGGTAADDHTAYSVGSDGDSITYALGGQYNLSSIAIYGGWPDGGRDQQNYEVLTSTNGVDFSALGAVNVNDGVQGTDTTPVSTRAEFTEDALPFLAQGVSHVRVNFLGVENGYTGYTEIDVFGMPVPEPTTAVGLSIMLGIGLLARRRYVLG